MKMNLIKLCVITTTFTIATSTFMPIAKSGPLSQRLEQRREAQANNTGGTHNLLQKKKNELLAQKAQSNSSGQAATNAENKASNARTNLQNRGSTARTNLQNKEQTFQTNH